MKNRKSTIRRERKRESLKQHDSTAVPRARKPIYLGGYIVERFGDWIITLAAAGVMIWWVWRRFDRWLHEPPGVKLRRLAVAGRIERDETVELIENNGYEVLSGKHRIPLAVVVDDGPSQATRLYFDYLAVKDDKYYLVKLERTRQPLEWTASGLRERLLVYALLFPDCEGILVVDSRDGLVRTVRFKVEDDE
jgi:hypothetical protein